MARAKIIPVTRRSWSNSCEIFAVNHAGSPILLINGYRGGAFLPSPPSSLITNVPAQFLLRSRESIELRLRSYITYSYQLHNALITVLHGTKFALSIPAVCTLNRELTGTDYVVVVSSR